MCVTSNDNFFWTGVQKVSKKCPKKKEANFTHIFTPPPQPLSIFIFFCKCPKVQKN